MQVLVIGSGGREHALAWKLSLSPDVTTVFVAPGNAGTATEANLQNVAISPDDHDGLATFAQENNIALTIVGPEAPLVDGIVNHFFFVIVFDDGIGLIFTVDNLAMGRSFDFIKGIATIIWVCRPHRCRQT